MFYRKTFTTLLTASTLTLGVTLLANQPTKAQAPSLVCETNNSGITVLNLKGSESDRTILTFMPDYFTSNESAQEACQQTVTKLYNLAQQGKKANFFTADKINDQPLVCAVENNISNCTSYDATQLFAFKPDLEEDPAKALTVMQSENPEEAMKSIRTLTTIYPDVRPWWQELFGVQ
jgi:hypothetical protein